jgi:hypothetical protein
MKKEQIINRYCEKHDALIVSIARSNRVRVIAGRKDPLDNFDGFFLPGKVLSVKESSKFATFLLFNNLAAI